MKTAPSNWGNEPLAQDRFSAQKRGQRPASGCLKVLLLTLLILLLFLGGCGGSLLLARSFVRWRLPTWEERYPTLALVLAITGRSTIPRAGLGYRGQDDRNMLPADIVLYPEALVETYGAGENQGSGYQRIDRTPDYLAQYLRERMHQQEWTLDREYETSTGGILFNWSKGERRCLMEVEAENGRSALWLRYGGT